MSEATLETQAGVVVGGGSLVQQLHLGLRVGSVSPDRHASTWRAARTPAAAAQRENLQNGLIDRNRGREGGCPALHGTSRGVGVCRQACALSVGPYKALVRKERARVAHLGRHVSAYCRPRGWRSRRCTLFFRRHSSGRSITALIANQRAARSIQLAGLSSRAPGEVPPDVRGMRAKRGGRSEAKTAAHTAAEERAHVRQNRRRLAKKYGYVESAKLQVGTIILTPPLKYVGLAKSSH